MFAPAANPAWTDVCRPVVAANHSLTFHPSIPPMASQLARILSRRASSALLGSALVCLTSLL